jgi:hypothetical protein
MPVPEEIGLFKFEAVICFGGGTFQQLGLIQEVCSKLTAGRSGNEIVGAEAKLRLQ